MDLVRLARLFSGPSPTGLCA
uniref:Uncharacterized protein n=2 Tax=Nannospalax galili TaxID=1026970 RepID=A0A8C6R6V5_NANGA